VAEMRWGGDVSIPPFAKDAKDGAPDGVFSKVFVLFAKSVWILRSVGRSE